MKRPSSPLSLEGLIAKERISLSPVSPTGEEKGGGGGGGGGGMEGVVMEEEVLLLGNREGEVEVEVEVEVGEGEGEGEGEEEEEEEVVVGVVNDGPAIMGLKKRRLGSEQVRALERSFEVENKLGPERKAQLARELGLQPRQVAVWFQNRRARWKAKQLERDFAALRARHDALRLQCDSLRRDKDALAAQIKELKAQLGNSEMAVKLEKSEAADDQPPAAIAKDIGTSDSDSSIVFNEDASPYSGSASDLQRFSLGFSSYFASSSSPPPPPFFDNKSQLHKTFLEEALLDEVELHNLSWYCSEEWGD